MIRHKRTTVSHAIAHFKFRKIKEYERIIRKNRKKEDIIWIETYLGRNLKHNL
jgi:hypothetical protein